MLRTHTCGELKKKDVSKEVILCGWVSTRRDHGDIIFIDLRDKHGFTQIVFDPQRNKEAHQGAHELKSEFCVRVRGKVSLRPEGTVNPRIPTGEIEVDVDSAEVLSTSLTPPFEVKDDVNISEDIRLKYRYLDLRRPCMQEKLRIRDTFYRATFDFLHEEGFTMVETPMLTKSTPEGARDYLVPSRLQAGNFYALPQSPQIFKQLLMVSGLEKYFQIARCFRDEDLRADRQPEFTQLDMEMSFITEEDLFDVCERMFKRIFKDAAKRDISIPFARMDYNDVVEKYGCDKPDTRFDVFISDLTDIVKESSFKIFREIVSSGGRIKGLAAPGYGSISRKDIDDLTAFVGEYGAKGLAYFKVEENTLTSPIAKFFSPETLSLIRERTGAAVGDMIFMVADDIGVTRAALSALRLKIGKDRDLIDKNRLDFLWVVNFPLFQWDKEEKRWVSEHHPFTSYREEDDALFAFGDLGRIRSNSYDLVLNGSEIGSGSIRIHRRDIQKKIFDTLGLSGEDCEKKFGFLLEAFNYGPPPHGGVAFGIDRLITLFTNDLSIREVIAFPKTQRGICPLSSAPSEVDDKQLRELGIKLRKQQEGK
ncbi:MAG: aspartate--tRNA ligase [Candidatus Omnitrophica bacterium]|nr:aspartate--tRNA ligase [Candidatus Omnitrophota bacterium]